MGEERSARGGGRGGVRAWGRGIYWATEQKITNDDTPDSRRTYAAKLHPAILLPLLHRLLVYLGAEGPYHRSVQEASRAG